MATQAKTPPEEQAPPPDQRVVMNGVPWSHYEVQLALRGESSVPRISYLEGAMELMSPSREHERIKSYIGCLIEAYALERDIDFSPYGQWTLKNAPKEAGLEPDECYIIGDQNRDVPDLAIEIVLTSGGLEKLEISRRLGVGEVWQWKASHIEVYVLEESGYERVEKSICFPASTSGSSFCSSIVRARRRRSRPFARRFEAELATLDLRRSSGIVGINERRSLAKEAELP